MSKGVIPSYLCNSIYFRVSHSVVDTRRSVEPYVTVFSLVRSRMVHRAECNR